MYVPSAFAETRTDVLRPFLRSNPLATLVTNGPDGLFASPVPMLLDESRGEHGSLLAHVARANPHWQLLEAGAPTLAVFGGPNAYVSPDWYPNKHATGRDVPTWNYATVHVHGTATAFADPDALLALLERLTDTHEAGRATPWRVADAPADYIRGQLGAIVGTELRIARMEGKFKLSQNRKAEDRHGARAGLAASHEPRDRAVAALMPD
ncbi:MAG TPA: FMN-binding negative transcriptional regulator [Xanthomonadales bacterium]|nr:FMN-binding negative transcriptional regulator [Xanthomonadales bacterium]